MPNLPDPDTLDQNEEAAPIIVSAEPMTKDEQLEAAERLQALWLRRMEVMLKNGSITSTDMATLFRFLAHNGWQVDPARLPKGLRDKITNLPDLDDFEDEEGVIPIRRPASA